MACDAPYPAAPDRPPKAMAFPPAIRAGNRAAKGSNPPFCLLRFVVVLRREVVLRFEVALRFTLLTILTYVPLARDELRVTVGGLPSL